MVTPAHQQPKLQHMESFYGNKAVLSSKGWRTMETFLCVIWFFFFSKSAVILSGASFMEPTHFGHL